MADAHSGYIDHGGTGFSSARSRRLHHPGRNLVELLPGSFSRCSNFPLDVDTMAENPPRPYVSSTRKIMPFHGLAVWGSPGLADSPLHPLLRLSMSLCSPTFIRRTIIDNGRRRERLEARTAWTADSLGRSARLLPRCPATHGRLGEPDSMQSELHFVRE